MVKNFAELQERVKSSEPLVVSVAQMAGQEVLLPVRAAAGQGSIKPVSTGDRERIEELCGHIRFKSLEILRAGTEEEAVEQTVRTVHDGSAQVLMKGLVNTSIYVRGILDRGWGLRTGRLLSTAIVYETPGYYKLLFCSDSGINVAPSLERKKDIFKNLLCAVRNTGIQNPKVAAFTTNEMVDPKVASTTNTAGLVETVKNEEGFPPCTIEGLIVFGAAFDPELAAYKKIDSRITGDVNLVIFPDIETDNIMGKSWIHLCRSPRSGIMPGASSPVALGLHSDIAEIKLSSIILACLTARSGK